MNAYGGAIFVLLEADIQKSRLLLPFPHFLFFHFEFILYFIFEKQSRDFFYL